jgi:60 kDa SS-A/Ro ribonucleoprotein
MGWQALRMNLNALARNGAFDVKGTTEAVAARLADAQALSKVRPMPYQLQMALEDALEQSLGRVPVVAGRVVVCPDVSGSMSMPVTGYRKGASSKVRCIQVAALVAAAMLRTNREARMMPFECDVVKLRLDPKARVAVNAAALAKIGGGGTNVSAPLARLNAEKADVDLVVIVSDNESWVDATKSGATATMHEWDHLVRRNPDARLVCVDIAPYGTAQASGRRDILNVGGFSDAVFDTIDSFASGETRDWISIVEATEI